MRRKMSWHKVVEFNRNTTNKHQPIPIEWDDDFNTGIDVIDLQHRHLVKLINHLYDLQLQGGGDKHQKSFRPAC